MKKYIKNHKNHRKHLYKFTVISNYCFLYEPYKMVLVFWDIWKGFQIFA